MPRSNSVSGGRSARRWAMAPYSVCRPVAVTTHSALPLRTLVPRYTQFSRSRTGAAAATVPARFSAGKLSPLTDRLGDEEIGGLQQDAVSRHDAAGRQMDDVADHDL